ncbi:MAG TPA: cytochrome d ubiquinol oxidase subunit II [Trebonia sp.]|jgi:cytochrome d ubiquinol oxidase subunit II
MLFFWMIVILFAVLAYVILDGYDLGIGALTLFEPDAARRRQMLEVVGNVWDGNESWLILVAMGLWGGFPDAYATALPGLYIPLLVTIFALIFRGFSVEMALHRAASDRTWTRLFGVGSLVAAFAQGVLFGGLLCGVTVRYQLFAGATWDFFGHGYAVLTGLVTVALFCLAGAAMLQAKSGGVLRDQMTALIRPLTLITVSGVALSAALLPVATSAHLHLGAVDRWVPFAYAVLVAVGGFWTAYRRAGRAPDLVPFLAVAAAQIAGLAALVALYYPQIVPPSVTLHSSGASRETLAFVVIATCVFLPGTIAYHVYSNWVFRGRQPLDDSTVPGGRHTAPTTAPRPPAAEGGN